MHRSGILTRTLLAASVAQGLASTADATPFVHETVDGPAFTGYYASATLDAADRPHLAYYEFTNRNLRYATKVGSAWVVTSVDTTGDVGLYPSIAVDAAGNPHIGYRDASNGDLKYARKSGGVWTTEVADAGVSFGAYASLELDAAGNPRIAHLDGVNIDLRFSQKNAGVWSSEIVAGAGASTVGYYCSLALDATGRPHISYFDNNTDDLRYALKNAGLWTTELVDSTGFAGATSIALDRQGNPRIAYRDDTPVDLRFATRSSSGWTTETVDSVGGPGGFCSLQINDAGNPRISYSGALSSSDLKYASRSTVTWTIETVDATGDVGYYTSLSLDSQGNPRIAYMDFSNGDVRYTDSAVHVVSPSGGETWPVGSLRDVTWSGVGPVNILLSADGGLTEEILVENVEASPVTIRVPHLPSRFARVGIRRASPLSTAFSDTLLTIETSISLLSFAAAPPAGSAPGVKLSWSTQPGAEDLAGYEVERASGASGVWHMVKPLTRETAFSDAEGGAGARYRLTAVNGLGERFVLGEVVAAPSSVIAAWPLPYRGGPLQVTFATASGLGGGPAQADLSLYDVSGRLVRTIAQGVFAPGIQSATWDGLDAGGRPVASGTYFLRSRSGSHDAASMKVAIAR